MSTPRLRLFHLTPTETLLGPTKAVQKELVADTRLSTLHCRALSEFLQQDMDKVGRWAVAGQRAEPKKQSMSKIV